MAVGSQGYLEMLQALLPRGPAWPRGPDATLTRLLHAVADGLAEVDGAGEALLDEIQPGTTVDLLADWERVLGLPDACSGGSLDSTVTGRRGVVMQTLRRQLDTTLATYVAIARDLGYAADVVERDQATATRLAGVDTSGGRWAYVWWLRVQADGRERHLDTLSPVTAPLVTRVTDAELECRIRRAAPAHTYPVIVYRPTLGGPL